MSSLSPLLLTFGVVALAVSWVQLLITSSREDFTWGLCTFFMPPLSYGYSLVRLDITKDSLILAVIGCVLIFLGL